MQSKTIAINSWNEYSKEVIAVKWGVASKSRCRVSNQYQVVNVVATAGVVGAATLEVVGDCCYCCSSGCC